MMDSSLWELEAKTPCGQGVLSQQREVSSTVSPQHATQPPSLCKRTSSKESNEEPPALWIGRSKSLSPEHFIKYNAAYFSGPWHTCDNSMPKCDINRPGLSENLTVVDCWRYS